MVFIVILMCFVIVVFMSSVYFNIKELFYGGVSFKLLNFKFLLFMVCFFFLFFVYM